MWFDILDQSQWQTGIAYMPYIKELGNLWFVPSLHLDLSTRVYQDATGI